MDFSAVTKTTWVENEENYAKMLSELSSWDEIPLLNVIDIENLKDSSLVRFKGMVQDMHGPEYYLEKFEVYNEETKTTTTRNGKYCDAAITNEKEKVDMYNSGNVTSERQSYVVVSVPAVNEWVNVIEKDKFKLKESNFVAENKGCKRSFEEAMETEDNNKNSENVSNTKKSCSQENTEAKSTDNNLVSKDYILNFPIPDRAGKKCHLKVYTNSDSLKLNETYEFVGFIATDPLIESVYQADEMEDKMEVQTRHPPSSLVPRIHTVCFKKLEHYNPLINSVNLVLDENKANYVKKELILVLTQLLLGDELAAEYLIYYLISEVYLRRDFMPLGKFSLNISNVPILQNIDFVEELYKFIEMMITKSHYLSMSLENMNSLDFTPKKDYECNRLTSGMLQLSPNTHLVLDETKMSAGKLEASGVNNMKTIAYAIKNQKVSYDFNYYPIEYDCDIPFLILSEGKSMLTPDVHVPLKPDEVCAKTFPEIVVAARHFLKPELLNSIRMYLTQSRLTKYELSSGVQDLVQQQFVNMRQKGAVSADDLHSLLVLARLICISEGKTTLDEQCWQHACRLEEQRKSRLPK